MPTPQRRCCSRSTLCSSPGRLCQSIKILLAANHALRHASCDAHAAVSALTAYAKLGLPASAALREAPRLSQFKKPLQCGDPHFHGELTIMLM